MGISDVESSDRDSLDLVGSLGDGPFHGFFVSIGEDRWHYEKKKEVEEGYVVGMVWLLIQDLQSVESSKLKSRSPDSHKVIIKDPVTPKDSLISLALSWALPVAELRAAVIAQEFRYLMKAQPLRVR